MSNLKKLGLSKIAIVSIAVGFIFTLASGVITPAWMAWGDFSACQGSGTSCVPAWTNFSLCQAGLVPYGAWTFLGLPLNWVNVTPGCVIPADTPQNNSGQLLVPLETVKFGFVPSAFLIDFVFWSVICWAILKVTFGKFDKKPARKT